MLGKLYYAHVVLKGVPDYICITDQKIWDEKHTMGLNEEQLEEENITHWIEDAMAEYGFTMVDRSNPCLYTCDTIPKTDEDIKDIEERLKCSILLLTTTEISDCFCNYDAAEQNEEFTKAAHDNAKWKVSLKPEECEGPYHLGPADPEEGERE